MARNDPAWKLRDHLVRIMDEQQISQAELARRVGVTRAHVSQLLKSDNKITLQTAEALLNALGYTIIVNVEKL